MTLSPKIKTGDLIKVDNFFIGIVLDPIRCLGSKPKNNFNVFWSDGELIPYPECNCKIEIL